MENINNRIRQFAESRNSMVEIIQSNSESVIIDALHGAENRINGVVINPGAYAHYSLAIHDAIAGISLPVIEVHLTNIFAGDKLRQQSVVACACHGVICGLGWRGYIAALEALLNILKKAWPADRRIGNLKEIVCVVYESGRLSGCAPGLRDG